MNLYLVPVALAVSVIAGVGALECYTCNNLSDPQDCNTTTICGGKQACFMQTTHSSTGVSYKAGCLDNQQCDASHVSPGLVGRDIHTRQQSNCHECCSSNLCNQYLCSHAKPTSCIDSATIDCALTNSLFSICQDTHHAATVCPRFCGLCDVVDGNWAAWSDWSACDVTCENGTQIRTRTCTSPAPERGGLNCTGSEQETKICVKELCPVHGGWSSWGNWDTCSVSCGVGMQNRFRTCTNPRPNLFGDHCFGQSEKYRMCMLKPCSNGGWSSWSAWGSCSSIDRLGLKLRQRQCNNPTPSPFGLQCQGANEQSAICNDETVAFNAHHISSLISSSGGSRAVFQNIFLNEGNGYNEGTGYFTAPESGVYSFSTQLCEHGTAVIFRLVKKTKNSTEILSKSVNAEHNDDTCSSVTVIIRLNVNEQVYVEFASGWNSMSNISQDTYRECSFTGTIISN